MCGIFGIISYNNELLTIQEADSIKQLVVDLLKESEIRGRHASGILIITENKAFMYKNKVSGSELPNMIRFKHTLNTINQMTKFKSIIGHTRSQTKGDYKFNINNHPIVAGHIIGVHNGIISNDDSLFEKYKGEFERKGGVDSEIIFQLINYYTNKGFSLSGSVRKASEELIGSYACAFVDTHQSNQVVVFRGASYPEIFIRHYKNLKLIIFASLDIILQRSVLSNSYFDKNNDYEPTRLKGSQGLIISTINGSTIDFKIKETEHMYNFYL